MLKEHNRRLEETLEDLRSLDSEIEDNETVQYVRNMAQWFYEEDVDTIPIQKIERYSGRLYKCMGDLERLAEKARAQREASEQHYEELKNELIEVEYADTEKITYAKSQAESQLTEVKERINELNYKRRSYNMYYQSAKRLASYCQTILSLKKNELYQQTLSQEA